VRPEEQEDDGGERTMFVTRAQLFEAARAVDPLANYLVVLEGSVQGGKRLEIGAEPITIGRGQTQTLVCDDRDVSRQHAKISVVNGTVVLEDLNSTNGTFVDDEQISGAVTLKDGARIRLGRQLFKYERRSRAEVKKADELERDIRKASDYVHSLLPAPIDSGPVRTAWRFVPSAQLGGDAFGYYWFDQQTFVFYLMDVSGHGAGSAMHSVSVLNVLRQRALPNVDFKNPAEVLASLNERFPVSEHNGLYFTMWYGVYDTGTRQLSFGTAGHGPAILVPEDKQGTQELGMSAMMIGMLPDQTYEVRQMTIPEGSTLFVFSDGAYEILTKDGDRWELENFVPLLTASSVAGVPEPERIYQAIKQVVKPGPLDDDLSLMAVTFP
jgi:serine phosphatase RsbU (regulator of sigma subunit)